MHPWLLGLWLLGLLSVAQAGTLTEHTFQAKSYQGSQDRQYQVYVPDGIDAPAPLVMVLHGCSQTHEEVMRDWGMKEAADRNGFIMVAPFITQWNGLRGPNCWGFWFPQHRQRGRGEPEDLYQIALEVEQNFPVDPQRRYLTGLSSGGAMTAILAVTHNDYWAAVATAAGLPYGEDATAVSLVGICPGWAQFHPLPQVVSDMRGQLADTAYPMPLLVLQNNHDCTVKQPAGLILRDAQLALYGDPSHRTPVEVLADEINCSPVYDQDFDCRHARYTHDGNPGSRSLVETVFFNGPLTTRDSRDKDLGHYWVSGQDGRDGPYALRQGPSYPDIIWAFFARHPRDDSLVSFAGPPTGCISITSSPMGHLYAGRGRLVNWGMAVLGSGDQSYLGLSWNWWSPVTLYEGVPGQWHAAKPPGCRMLKNRAGAAVEGVRGLRIAPTGSISIELEQHVLRLELYECPAPTECGVALLRRDSSSA